MTTLLWDQTASVLFAQPLAGMVVTNALETITCTPKG
jgi:hypothetical protein